jgi:hypothetical protein
MESLKTFSANLPNLNMVDLNTWANVWEHVLESLGLKILILKSNHVGGGGHEKEC